MAEDDPVAVWQSFFWGMRTPPPARIHSHELLGGALCRATQRAGEELRRDSTGATQCVAAYAPHVGVTHDKEHGQCVVTDEEALKHTQRILLKSM